jgi:L-seryl-tRNA(Ser) seleniumtransferase
LNPSTAVLLKVHWSNFEMKGYVQSVSPKDLAELAHRHGLVMMEDLGSGALLDFSQFGVAREPMPQEGLRDGVDVVTFSGDKLLGGPQAGIILGRSDHIGRMKKNPLARALRVDKIVLAAMEETLRCYLEPDTVTDRIPTLQAIACVPEKLEARARAIAARLTEEAGETAGIEVAPAESQVGGGSLPTAGLSTWVIQMSSPRYSPDQLVARLRRGDPPIIARIMNDQVIIDLRTVQPSEDGILAQMIVAALAGGE